MIRELKISTPTKADRAALSLLFRTTITDTVKKEKLYNEEEVIQSGIEEKLSNLESYFGANENEEFVLIAKFNATIVGTIAFGKATSLILDNVQEDLSQIPEIKSVYILPAFQKKGIGSYLFDEIRTILRQRGIAQYCLDCGYKRSQLYWKKKLGEAQYTLKDYWSKGNDHLIWILALEN